MSLNSYLSFATEKCFQNHEISERASGAVRPPHAHHAAENLEPIVRDSAEACSSQNFPQIPFFRIPPLSAVRIPPFQLFGFPRSLVRIPSFQLFGFPLSLAPGSPFRSRAWIPLSLYSDSPFSLVRIPAFQLPEASTFFLMDLKRMQTGDNAVQSQT
jgi:hypothetical protein